MKVDYSIKEFRQDYGLDKDIIFKRLKRRYRGLWERCYEVDKLGNPTHPTYYNKVVICEEWHSFKYFVKEWAMKQPNILDLLGDSFQVCIDKDITPTYNNFGQKMYCNTCQLVSRSENTKELNSRDYIKEAARRRILSYEMSEEVRRDCSIRMTNMNKTNNPMKSDKNRQRVSKPVIVTDLKGNKYYFSSRYTCAEHYKVSPSMIRLYVNRKRFLKAGVNCGLMFEWGEQSV